MSKKLYFVVQHFRSGGAERVASILINELSARGYDIIVESDFTYGLNYPLSDGVKKVQTFLKKPGKNIFQVVLYFIQRLKHRRANLKKYNPDVVISFLSRTFFETKLCSIGLNKKHIVSDHTAMDRRIGYFNDYIRHHFYNYADYTTILTQKDAALIKGKLNNAVVVYNPLTFKSISSNNIIERDKIILCVGRINQWYIKGYDRICKIWGEISSQFPDWKLCFLGDASDATKEHLRNIANVKNISQQIIFYGQQSDVISFYHKAAIFALPSRTEGFPMALIEAMSQGCASVAFSLNGAINEIIDDNSDGYIVTDDNLIEFKEKLIRLLSDQEQRYNMAQRAAANISRFDKARYTDKWIKLLEH